MWRTNHYLILRLSQALIFNYSAVFGEYRELHLPITLHVYSRALSQ
jgi:hypothetical protein